MRLRALALLLGLASPLAAQDTTATEQPTAVPWRLSYFPYLTVSPNDGLMGIARAIVFRQAEYGDRISLRDAVATSAASGDTVQIPAGHYVLTLGQIQRINTNPILTNLILAGAGARTTVIDGNGSSLG